MSNLSVAEDLYGDQSIRKAAFGSLMGYTKFMNPGYLVARHNALCAQKLEAVERGEINRLIIAMPPRHGKTHLISENFPCWYLGRNPTKQIIYSTYSHERASDVGKKVRDYMLDPQHRHVFNSGPDPQSKSSNRILVENEEKDKGIYISTGAGGAITGRGAHVFIIDDPIKGRQDADSPTRQRQLREWFTSVAYTRLMPGNSAIIIVMTRWTYNDLVGYVMEDLAHENWEVLSLEAIASREGDAIGRAVGQALWPKAYPLTQLLRIRQTLTTREWNALYQQQPLPESGGLCNIDDFGRYDYKEWLKYQYARWRNDSFAEPPFKITGIACCWDTAFKEEQIHDPSACTVWAYNKAEAYLIAVINKKMAFPKLKRNVIKNYMTNRKLSDKVSVLVEDKASGQSLIQQLRYETNIPVLAREVKGSKVLRFENQTPLIAAGKIYLPDKAPWLVPYETQVARFPQDVHDDMVDSTSLFLEWFGRPRYMPSLKPQFWK
jgi:predicted phage terminase large subunit-like protein